MTVNKWIKNRIFAIAILLSIIFSSGYSSYAATAFVNQETEGGKVAGNHS